MKCLKVAMMSLGLLATTQAFAFDPPKDLNCVNPMYRNAHIKDEVLDAGAVRIDLQDSFAEGSQALMSAINPAFRSQHLRIELTMSCYRISGTFRLCMGEATDVTVTAVGKFHSKSRAAKAHVNRYITGLQRSVTTETEHDITVNSEIIVELDGKRYPIVYDVFFPLTTKGIATCR